uniref:DUF4456 domain-containing protein n=1 Tax=Caenorhabditis tropicalis TaxID=1561998 RepID=A0A1I7T959_9PELO
MKIRSCWRSVNSFLNELSTSCDTKSPATYSSDTTETSNEKITGKDLCNSTNSSDTSTGKLDTSSISSREDTVIKDKEMCMNLQFKAATVIDMTIIKSVDQFATTYRKQKSEYDEIVEEGEEFWKNHDKFMNYLEVVKEIAEEELDMNSAVLDDTVNQALSSFNEKESIENFVRDYEEFYDSSQVVLEKIHENKERAAHIYKIMKKTKDSHSFEKKDIREENVYMNVLNMIQSLPLNDEEQTHMKSIIRNIERDSTLEVTTKCEMIFRNLFLIMSTWNTNNRSTFSDSNSDNWNSVNSIGRRSEVLVVKDIPSEFALTNNSIVTDFNLNDLEEDLRSARIRRAVEGPNQIYECSPWDTESYHSRWSSKTSEHSSSYQSIHKTFSFSVLSNCIPNTKTTAENVIHRMIEPTITTSPEPAHERKAHQVSEPENNSVSSLNFSNVSLGEMAGEALHTAKDVGQFIIYLYDFCYDQYYVLAETQGARLVEALQSSVQKCGTVLTDLITAVSSSSESVSSTQSSHQSSYSITH